MGKLIFVGALIPRGELISEGLKLREWELIFVVKFVFAQKIKVVIAELKILIKTNCVVTKGKEN